MMKPSVPAGFSKAVALGAPVEIVYLTYGENNQLSFVVYKKRPVLSRKELLAMGRVA